MKPSLVKFGLTTFVYADRPDGPVHQTVTSLESHLHGEEITRQRISKYPPHKLIHGTFTTEKDALGRGVGRFSITHLPVAREIELVLKTLSEMKNKGVFKAKDILLRIYSTDMDVLDRVESEYPEIETYGDG
jgi:hypothetical protein